MNRAQRRAVALRRELDLKGRIDAEAVAHELGLELWLWDFEVQTEMQLDGHVAVGGRLDPAWRRWVIAHAIGHRLLHPGKHFELRSHTDLPRRALLVDDDEAIEEGLVHSWEVADHFGVPEEAGRPPDGEGEAEDLPHHPGEFSRESDSGTTWHTRITAMKLPHPCNHGYRRTRP